jgi:seryl-tRNA synthetase
MPHRWICTVFEEMRALDKTRNYRPLLSLIEEAQAMANRMEAKLYDAGDLEELPERIKDLKAEVKALEQQKRELERD